MATINVVSAVKNTFIYLFENDLPKAWQEFTFGGIDFLISVTATTVEMIAWDTVNREFHLADNSIDAKAILLDAIIERG